jgi:hypothetical protein
MMRKILALGLALCLLTACGEKPASSAESAETEIQTFGVSVLPEEAAAAPEPSQAPASAQEPADLQETSEEVAEAAETQDYVEEILRAALYSEFVDDYHYQKDDPVYFWRAVSYLVGQVDSAAEGDTVTLTAQDMEPYVHAIFGEYTEQYPSTGEENPVISSSYEDGQEVYHVTRRDLSDFSLDWEGQQEGDTLTCTATVAYQGRSGQYRLTLAEDPAGPFAYSLRSVEEITD